MQGAFKIKESDPTLLSLFVDLALLNRLVRSLPRNSLPDHPPTQPGQTHTQTNKQTNRRGAAEQPLHGHVASRPAPTHTQDKEIDIPFRGAKKTPAPPSFGSM